MDADGSNTTKSEKIPRDNKSLEPTNNLWPDKNWTTEDWERFFNDDEEGESPPRIPRWMISVLGFLILIGFLVWSVPALSPLLFDNMDYLNQNIELSQEPMVEQARQAVVAITVTGREVGSQRTGTGFAVTNDGWILTNMHVVKDARTIKVALENGKEYYVTNYQQLKSYDIAVLKIKTDRIPYLNINQDFELRPGQDLTIVGNPLGFMRIAVRGPVLAINKYDPADQGGMLKMAAEIRPGSSGSPIMDANGQVVGIIFGIQESVVGDRQVNLALGLSLDLVMDDLKSQGIVK